MSVTYSQHAIERMTGRLSPAEEQTVRARVDVMAAEHPSGCGAARVMKVPERQAPDGSTGDRVIVVMKDQTVLTVELRRSTQAWNRGAVHAPDGRAVDWLDFYDNEDR